MGTFYRKSGDFRLSHVASEALVSGIVFIGGGRLWGSGVAQFFFHYFPKLVEGHRLAGWFSHGKIGKMFISLGGGQKKCVPLKKNSILLSV